MINIFSSHGGVPMLYIRYNPDNYKDKSGKTVKPSSKREEELIRWVEKCRNELPRYQCSVVFLFYDRYDEGKTEIYRIDPYKSFEKECSECEKVFYLKSMYRKHVC